MKERVKTELYEGRGITICKEWYDFLVFHAYVMTNLGERPTPDHSLDRIDNDCGYEPGNVRWATPQEQARNRSTNRYVSIDKERVVIAEASKRSGINDCTYRGRLRRGWDPKTAMTKKGTFQ